MENKKKNKVHIKITAPTENEMYQALNEFHRLQKYLTWVPVFILISGIIIFALLMKLLELKLPVFILIFAGTVWLLKELSTLIFSVQMRRNIMQPLGNLKIGFDEIAKGNYGYKVDAQKFNGLGGLMESFNQMSQELKEANDLKERYEGNRKELIAGISHDLKTPITSIVGYVDAINTGIANNEEKRERYLNIISSNAHYTNRLIDDLFLFSKLDINQMKYEFSKVPIKDFLEDVVIEKKLELEERGVVVYHDIEVSDDMKLEIDGKMVYRILSNILSNAQKYGDSKDPRINIKAIEIEGGVKVIITDNGQGIDKENINQIFDVFYRADQSRNKDIGGSGLGLAIAKELVKAHNGEIWADSKIGIGTAITFTLTNGEAGERNV